MKKLKKKHQPMTIQEWSRSMGGVETVYRIATDEQIERMVAEHTEEKEQAFAKISEAYHDYVCAHIEYLQGKR